jgi:hypothetical protein
MQPSFEEYIQSVNSMLTDECLFDVDTSRIECLICVHITYVIFVTCMW